MWLMDLHDEEWLLRHQGLQGARCWHLEKGHRAEGSLWPPDQVSGVTSVQMFSSSCPEVLASKDLTSNLLQSHISSPLCCGSEGDAPAAAKGEVQPCRAGESCSAPAAGQRFCVTQCQGSAEQLKLHCTAKLLIKGVRSWRALLSMLCILWIAHVSPRAVRRNPLKWSKFPSQERCKVRSQRCFML